MPRSKSKQNVLAVRSGRPANARRENAPQRATRLPLHPALGQLPDIVRYRMGETIPLRLPDESNDPSAAKVLKSEYTVSSDAAGHAVFGEQYNLSGSRCSWTVTAGTTGTTNTTVHPQNTAFQTEARVARMVAYRVSVMYIGAEQTSAGYLSYEEKVLVSDVASLSVDALHTGNEVQVKAQDGLVVYVDYTQQPRWEDPTVATFCQYTFPCACFIASGLPVSTPVFRVKVERFLEYLPNEGVLSEGELNHEPHDPGALSAHGALSGTATSVHKHGAGDAFRRVVGAAANAAFHMAQPLVPYVVSAARNHLTTLVKLGLPMLLA